MTEGARRAKNSIAPTFFAHPLEAFDVKIKSREAASWEEGRREGRAAGSRLCIFAVNASRSVPSRMRKRDPTKPALFEL